MQRVLAMTGLLCVTACAAVSPQPDTAQSGERQLIPLSVSRPKIPGWICDAGISGWVELTYTVTPEGRVSDISVSAAEPKHVYEASAVQDVAGWRYAPSPAPRRIVQRINFGGSDECQDVLDVVRSPQDCPAPLRDGQIKWESSSTPTDRLSRGTQQRSLISIQQEFDRNKPLFAKLREDELLANPCIDGKAILSIAINPDGSVAATDVYFSNLMSPHLVEAVRNTVSAMNFGPATGEGYFVLRYPIAFGNDDAVARNPDMNAATESLGLASPYARMILNQIMADVVYPAISQRNMEEGLVKVRVQVKRDGTIVSTEIVVKSGFPALDAEAQDVFVRIGKLPPVPADIYPEADTFVFRLPLNFKLQ